MELWEETKACLQRKREILDSLAANTELQCKFIRKRNLKGLNRSLGVQGGLIEALAAVNARLAKNPAAVRRPDIAALLAETAARQQEILERSRQAVRQAVAEQAGIAAELRGRRLQRQINNQYVNPWASMAQGLRLNKKG